jgi:hypothetical protein
VTIVKIGRLRRKIVHSGIQELDRYGPVAGMDAGNCNGGYVRAKVILQKLRRSTDFLVSISYNHLMIKLLSVSVFVIGSLAMGQDCSNATLRGAYAYASDGTATDDGKTFTNSEVGRVVFDGAGKLTARVASTTNGVTTVADAAGEYLIGSDCTMTGRTPDGLEFDGVVVNSGADFFIMLREPGLTRSGAGTKIEATGACSTATLNSSFGYFAEGTLTVDGTVIGLGELGILKFDGAGGVTGVYSTSSKGLVERKTFSGT